MSILSLCVVLVVLCGTSLAYPFSPYASCSTAYNMDYLLLAIQWSPSFCYSQKCVPHDDSWSIHGTWPQYFNNSWPQFCCFQSEFDVQKLASIRGELDKKWLSLKASGTSESFWKHEWQKHGTCAMHSEELKGQFNYFHKTLSMFDSYPLKEWLAQGNIVPSANHAYTLDAIHESIETKFGHKVELECLKKKPYPLLAHIYLCFDKTLKPIDCRRKDDAQCGKGFVLLPEAKHVQI